MSDAGSVNNEYKSKLRSLMFNLKDANNPDLRGHVMGGQIPPAELVRLSADDLANKELAAWRKKRMEEHDKEIVLDVETAAKVRGWAENGV
jgi:transcription elongation factor S-II